MKQNQRLLLHLSQPNAEFVEGISSTIGPPDLWKLFVSLVFISLACLFATLILHILIWDKHNYHGWTQFSYLLALFLFDLVFIVALCPGLGNGMERNLYCKILSILNQYFFMSSNTWLVIISLNIYNGIRKTRIGGAEMKENIKRFLIYFSIGWGFPLVLVVIGIVQNFQYMNELPAKNLDDLWIPFPDYGFQHCRLPYWIIWECFVIGNCLFHFFMFGLIGFTIIWKRRRISGLPNSSSNRPSSCVTLIKLFIVVGLSWSYIAVQDILKAGNINTKQGWAWHVFRSIFFLQGAFISGIILTNGKTITHLGSKYPRLKKICDIHLISEIKGKLCLKRKGSIESCASQKTIDSVLSN